MPDCGTTHLLSTTANAERLARSLHAGQVDQGGRPYVEHLAAVVAMADERSELRQMAEARADG